MLDFGLAKVTSEGQTDSGLTREGQMLGTPDFIAPEQIRNAQSADIRADIYSLGCTFYYLLTGGPPFRGEHLWDVYQAHFSMDAGPLNLVRPEVPVELAVLVAKMMAKEPSRRFQTPGDVARALTPFFKTGGVAAKGANPEISQAGQLEAEESTLGAVSAPLRPATERTPAAASEVRNPAPPQPGSILAGLIDLRETEPLFDKVLDTGLPVAALKGSQWNVRPWPTAVEKLSRFGPRTWWAAAGVLLLGLVVACVEVVIKVKTANGTIVLENVPADAVVEIDGDRITVTPTVGERVKIEVSTGKHGVLVKRGNDVLLGESVTVESGKYFKLTARLEKTELHSITPSGGRIEPRVAERPESTESPATTKTADVVHPPAADNSQFTGLSGQWRVEGDELVQTDATRPYSELLFGDNQWTNYDFTVDAMCGGGGNSFALFFRSTNWNNEYAYVLSGDDSKPCTAEVREEGKSELLRYGFSIKDRRWYTPRVHVRGNHFVCSIYDQATGTDIRLFDYHDERHPKGRVGLQTFGSSVRFKNIKVTSPDGKVLWEGLPSVGQTRQTALADPSIAEQESSVPASANPGRKKKLLAITESAAFVHKVAPTQVGQVLYELGESGGFEVIFSQDSGWWIKPEHLKDFDAVFFYTSGELSITPEGKTALLEFVRSGKGFAGSHCAADTFYKWQEYGELIGAYFNKHLGLREVAIRVDDPAHPSTRHLDKSFRLRDEIYQFKAPFSRDKLHILMHFDYPGVTNGGAMAWTKDYGKGRVFYTALGHDEAVWNDERFRKHLLGGLRYVLNLETLTPESRSRGWASLFNGKDLTGWVVDSGSKNSWRIENGSLVVTGPGDYRESGWLLTERDYSDFILKFEFQPSPGTNSGVAFWAQPEEVFERLPHHPQIELFDGDKRDIRNGSFVWSKSIRSVDIVPPDRAVEIKEPGLWNTVEMEVHGNRLGVMINGRVVLRRDVTKLAESPNAHPGLLRRSGRIGFQSHTGTVRFRNIEINELSPAPLTMPQAAKDSARASAQVRDP